MNCLWTRYKILISYMKMCYMIHGYEELKQVPGSGALGAPEEHKAWFGHPWHAEDFPACSLLLPGQSE